MLLFIKSSLVASAAIALVISAAKLLVNVASAAALVDASITKFAAIAFSASVARIISAANALVPAVKLEST